METENMAGWWSTPLKNMKVTGIIVPTIWKKNEKQPFQTTNQMENVQSIPTMGYDNIYI
jgi:hypothetical protein